MEKVMVRIISPVLPLYRNHSIDLLHISVGWILHNENTGLNPKSGWLVKVNIYLSIHVLVFASNSIFYFILSCLEKNYDLRLKDTKKLLSIIFQFSLISGQYLPLKAVFYRFCDVSCRHCESIVVLKRC